MFLRDVFFFAANCFRDDRFAIAEEDADVFDDHGFARFSDRSRGPEIPDAVRYLGEVTLNTILSLLLSERPTLLIDQPARTKELERALRIISRPGGGIARKGQLLDPFCPVVLCMAEPLHDRWLLDQAIPVLLTPTQRPLPRLDAQLLERTAKAFQAKLFQYREINLDSVRESQYDAPQFSSPTREIAVLLGSAIIDEPALTRLIIPLHREPGPRCPRSTDGFYSRRRD